MSNDVECPYCGKGQEINHDDGYGYEVDEIYEQGCPDCKKVFAFTTSIHFHYDARKAPCLNDGEHDWKAIIGFPVEYFEGKQRCGYCAEERTMG